MAVIAPTDKKRATKWTDEKVKALKLPDGKVEFRTLVAPGLYLHARGKSDGSVAKHWQYRAQVGGVRRWLALGAYPAVSLAQANQELLGHQKAQGAAKKGEADHPVTAARFARRSAVAIPTVSQVFGEWIADKKLGNARKQGKPVRQRTVDVLTENFDADIRSRIGDAKVGKLTREGIQACLDGPRKRGAPALRRTSIARCVVWSVSRSSAATSTAPTRCAPSTTPSRTDRRRSMPRPTRNSSRCCKRWTPRNCSRARNWRLNSSC